MQELAGHLAHTLRTLRAQRGWSLTQAAEYTGVSKAMLGQIERGESSPTVATLWKIATGFNVAFSAFLEALPAAAGDAAPLRRSAGVRSGQRRYARGAAVSYDRQLGFDMFVIDLAPGALSESSPHEPGVIEHVIVISGRLVGDRRRMAQPGRRRGDALSGRSAARLPQRQFTSGA